jgi:hypothetical protein
MVAFKAGETLAVSSRAIFARAAALSALLALTGCASAPHQDYSSAGTDGVRVAQAVEVEADGLPAQTPPSARIRQTPDDPNEPFSRNYGGANPSAEASQTSPVDRAPVRAPAPVIPSDLPPAFREKLVTALAQDE